MSGPSLWDALGVAAKIATSDLDEVIDLVGEKFEDERHVDRHLDLGEALGEVVGERASAPSVQTAPSVTSRCARCDDEGEVVQRGVIVQCPACRSHPGARR
jgi:hypothetical protein